MDGAYVFRVRFRVTAAGDATVDPDAFETTFRNAAPAPGTDGWLFFREYLWRGNVTDHEHARRFVEARGVARGDGRLRVGAQVTLVGVGGLFEGGRYTLTTVRHTFDPEDGNSVTMVSPESLAPRVLDPRGEPPPDDADEASAEGTETDL